MSLDKVDTAELPGNDASWYRALLEDNGATGDDTRDVREAVAAPADTESPTPSLSLITEQALDVAAEPVPDTSVSGVLEDDISIVDQALVDETLPDVPGIEVEPEVQAEAEAQANAATQTPQVEPDEPASAEPDTPEVEDTVPKRELSPGQKKTEMVGQLWNAERAEGPIEGWAPEEMDPAVSSSRSFRWTSVMAVVAVIALVVVGLVVLPSLTRNRANAHRDMMVTTLHELRAELPATQTSLQIATEPGSTVTDLSDLSTQLTALTAKASAVDKAGRAALPKTLPLTSSGPIDALVPIQQRLEPLASTALTIQRRISNLVKYRTLMSGFLVLPELPTEADSAEQADLRVALASAQAQSASILGDLPDDVSLSDHAALARSINDAFATWQVDYLEALRTQDTVRAENLIGELQAQLDQLNAELITPLAQIRRQTDTDLIDLAATIDEVTVLADGGEPAP